MLQRACALLAADHVKMILEAVQVGEKYNSRLIKAGRGGEDVP